MKTFLESEQPETRKYDSWDEVVRIAELAIAARNMRMSQVRGCRSLFGGFP